MSILDSFLVALFGISIVFLVLILLSLIVKVQSIIFRGIVKNKKKSLKEFENIKNVTNQNENVLPSNELKLVGIDEKTAAMVMAIVCDETKIPLSELQFKTIRAID